MDSADSLVGVRNVDKYGNLDFAGTNHLNVDLSVIKSLKHLCSNACVAFHTGADNRNFGYFVIIEDFGSADIFHIILEALNSLFASALCNSKCNVLFAVVTD